MPLIKNLILSIIFHQKKYYLHSLEDKFTRIELLNMLKEQEKFLGNIFPGNTPSLDTIKRKLELDFLCNNIEVPIFFDRFYVLQEDYRLYQSILWEDYSHSQAEIDHDCSLTEYEAKEMHDQIEELTKSAEEMLEKTISNIFSFVLSLS